MLSSVFQLTLRAKQALILSVLLVLAPSFPGADPYRLQAAETKKPEQQKQVPAQKQAQQKQGQQKQAAEQVPQKQQTIKIGGIFSLTGQNAEACKSMLNGLNLYLDEIHHKMAGKPVELIVEDDQSSGFVAQDKMAKLVEKDKVQMFACSGLDDAGIAMAMDIDHYKLPLIVHSFDDDLTQRNRKKYLIRLSNTSSQPAFVFGEWACKKLGYKKIAMLSTENPANICFVGAFLVGFEKAGGEIIQQQWTQWGFKYYWDYVQLIPREANATLLLPIPTVAKTELKEYNEFGPKLPILTSGIPFDECHFKKYGDLALGSISILPYSAALDTKNNQRFVKAYQAKYGEDPGYYAESGYTTGMWVNKAVEALKGDLADKDKLLSALKAVELNDAPRGPIRLDSYASPIENFYVRKLEKLNGNLQNTVIATIPNVTQFWNMKPDEYFFKFPAFFNGVPRCTHCIPTPRPWDSEARKKMRIPTSGGHMDGHGRWYVDKPEEKKEEPKKDETKEKKDKDKKGNKDKKKQ